MIERLLKVEQEKAHLIVETIEPMLGMNAYLGLQDELITQLEQAVKNPQIVGLTVLLKGQKVWEKRRGAKAEDLKVLSPIKDPVDGHTIGSIELYYASDSFLAAAQEMKHQILWQLGLLAVGLLVFAIFARILLKPLGVIAHVVQSYSPGEKLQFPPLRKESETQAIAGAFTRMVDNVREYTALLERYKLSVDESSIVSRMSPQGAITYVNDEFCRVTGYAREELLNQKCDIVRSMENDAVFTEIWRVLQEKRIWKGTLTNRAKNGENFYVKSTIVPILDEEDEVVEYISIQHDVTQIIQQRELIDQQTTDPLTGLGNRVKLVQEISTEVMAAAPILVKFVKVKQLG
jgi:PAS domain S-box-containing protein